MEYLAVILIVLGGLAILVGLVTLAIPKTRKKGGVITLSAIAVMLIGAVMINFVDPSESDDKTSEEVSTDTEEPEETEEEQANITKEQYESVEIGETLAQVKKELGEVSEDNISTVDGGPMWTYSDDDLGLAYIYFSKDENKVVKKRELGILSENSDTETTKEGIVDNNDWNAQIKKIADSDKTETEKFDEVSKLAMDYSLSDQELKEFEDYIVNEYKTNNYLKDIHNDEYMLTNIFKSTAIDEHYSSSTPIKEFAFDFLQNTKYTYRGAEVVGSQFVLANEKQMNDSLALMK